MWYIFIMPLPKEANPVGIETIIVDNPVVNEGQLISGEVKGQEWLEVPVKPIHDSDIAKLPLIERVSCLRQTEKDYWQPHAVRENAALKDPPIPETTKLAGELYHFGLKQWEIAHREAILDQRNRQRKKYAPPAPPKTADAVFATETLLYDTLIDAFVKDYFLTPGGIDRLQTTAEDIAIRTSYQPSEIVNMLQAAQDRLQKLDIKEDRRFFAYKQEQDETFYRVEQARIMQQLVENAFGTDSATDNPDSVKAQVRNTARAILQFYWNNYTRLYPPSEDTPLAAFVNDVLYAGGISADPQVFLRTADWLCDRRRLKASNKKEKFIAELKITIGKSMLNTVDLSERIGTALTGQGKTLADFFKSPPVDLLLEWIRENGGRYLIGKYNDRLNSIESAFDYLKSQGRTDLLPEHLLDSLEDVPERVKPYLEMWESLAKIVSGWRTYVASRDPNIVILDILVSNLMDKKHVLGKLAEIAGTTYENLSSAQHYAKAVEVMDIEAFDEISKQTFLAEKILPHMFIQSAPEDYTAVLKQTQDNRELFRKIRDENLWFVAPNGDSFPDHANPAVARHNMKALTFYPDPVSGGHRVELDSPLLLNGKPIKITLYLDRQGNYYHEIEGKRVPSDSPIWLLAEMNSLIFDRLHRITSGEYGLREIGKTTETATGEGEEKKSKEVADRRNHYRTLTNRASGPIYTLQSKSAKEHAQYVKEKYGIDIYQETNRRREAGTLEPNQYITFVREVYRENMPHTPNIFACKD